MFVFCKRRLLGKVCSEQCRLPTHPGYSVLADLQGGCLPCIYFCFLQKGQSQGQWDNTAGKTLVNNPEDQSSNPRTKGNDSCKLSWTGSGVHSLAYMHAHLHAHIHKVIKGFFVVVVCLDLFVFFCFLTKLPHFAYLLLNTSPSNHGRKGFIWLHFQVTVYRWGKSGQELRQKP